MMYCPHCGNSVPALPSTLKKPVLCPFCATPSLSSEFTETPPRVTLPITSPRQLPPDGVGSELTRVLQEMGATPDQCGHCHHHALLMNQWGPDECWERRETIKSWLRRGYRELSLAQKVRTWAVGVVSVDWFDPYTSVLSTAIGRWRAKVDTIVTQENPTH